jgi:hypothetical protein
MNMDGLGWDWNGMKWMIISRRVLFMRQIGPDQINSDSLSALLA